MTGQQPPTLPVKLGDVIRVASPDYCYGAGTLRLRVVEIGKVQYHGMEPWLNLWGFELRADGSQFQSRTRPALVRLSALRHQPPE